MGTDSKHYKKISLPEPLIERIKKFIKENPESGYMNVSDFVRHATIKLLDRYESK